MTAQLLAALASVAFVGAATLAQAADTTAADVAAAQQFAREEMDTQCGANHQNDRHIDSVLVDGTNAFAVWHCGGLHGQVGYRMIDGKWQWLFAKTADIDTDVTIFADELVSRIHMDATSADKLIRMRDDPAVN